MIISEAKSKRIGINYIIITGGLAQNKVSQAIIKNHFIENNQIKIYYLSSYQNAISKGGVYFGLNHTKIISRFSQESIGIKVGNKIQIIILKGKILENKFSKTIIIKPTLQNQKLVQINVYSSNHKEILDDSDFIGRLIIYLNNRNNDDIRVEIKYDVVLTFQAQEVKTGKEMKIKFEYFK